MARGVDLPDGDGEVGRVLGGAVGLVGGEPCLLPASMMMLTAVFNSGKLEYLVPEVIT